MVCSAQPGSGGARFYEYRALNNPKFEFLASGSELDVDAATRDFTVNCLYFDPIENVIADPTGRALSDLSGDCLDLVPILDNVDPMDRTAHAFLLVRAIKFVARWEGSVAIDGDEFSKWIAQLPSTLGDELEPAGLTRLRQGYREVVKASGPVKCKAAATRIGFVAVRLHDVLSGEE
jgi:hypothetical protein